MTLVIKVVLVVLVALLLVGVGLRARKLHRDELRRRRLPRDPRLLAPPPSPYVASRGFRVLDEDGNATQSARTEPARPRIESDRDFVFSDVAPPLIDDAPGGTRRDVKWALERSAQRPRGHFMSRRSAVVTLLVVVVAGVALYAANYRHPRPNAAAVTTTTVAATTTTVPAWPSTFVAGSTSAAGALYAVPAQRYRVTVHASAGAVWVVYRMGPSSTLEYQGDVALGQSKTLVMTGASSITLGSPANATVNVGGSPVTYPTPLVSPLTLRFTPTAG